MGWPAASQQPRAFLQKRANGFTLCSSYIHATYHEAMCSSFCGNSRLREVGRAKGGEEPHNRTFLIRCNACVLLGDRCRPHPPAQWYSCSAATTFSPLAGCILPFFDRLRSVHVQSGNGNTKDNEVKQLTSCAHRYFPDLSERSSSTHP